MDNKSWILRFWQLAAETEGWCRFRDLIVRVARHTGQIILIRMPGGVWTWRPSFL